LELYLSSGPPEQDLAFERETVGKASFGSSRLFVYNWDEPALVLGYAQGPEGMDASVLARKKIPVLRRISGGKAVLSAVSLSFSLFLRKGEGFAEHPISELYAFFVEEVAAALQRCGIRAEKSFNKEKSGSPICFFSQSGETLLIGGRKFFGGAQMRGSKALMVHGTMLLNPALELHSSVFGVDIEELREKITSVAVDAEALTERLAGGISGRLGEKIDGPFCAVSSEDAVREQRGPRWSPTF